MSTATSSAPLPDDYVVELLSETGKRHCTIGWADDVDAAQKCYEAILRKKYPSRPIGTTDQLLAALGRNQCASGRFNHAFDDHWARGHLKFSRGDDGKVIFSP